MSIDLNNSNNLSKSIASNVNEDKEKRWKLIPQIEKGLDDLLVQTNNNPEIQSLKDSLNKMKDLKEKITFEFPEAHDYKELKLGKLIALKERNGYLEKLRQIEDIGSNLDWDDDEGILKEISDLLYN